MRSICLPLLLTSALFASSDARAAQSYDNCTGFITSVPASITTQGTWCLSQDLASSLASGALITVNAHNVTIDCNDFKIGGLSAGLTTRTAGILANNRNNITIRNCSLRGFFVGIDLLGSGHLVEGNRMDGNTFIAIRTTGFGSVIRGNRVLDTGGTDFSAAARAIGIYSSGDNEILSNLISAVDATSGSGQRAYGVQAADNLIGSIIDNNIKAVVGDGAGQSHAIALTGSTGMVLVDSNNLVDTSMGASIAVSCPASNSVVLSGNVTHGFTVPTDNCAHDGGNLVY